MSNKPEEDSDWDEPWPSEGGPEDHPHAFKIFLFILGAACGAAFLLICQKW
jgi:hypothetical protein